jgi:hypothetical protein
MMKKLWLIPLLLAILFALASCGGQGECSESASKPSSESESDSVSESESEFESVSESESASESASESESSPLLPEEGAAVEKWQWHMATTAAGGVTVRFPLPEDCTLSHRDGATWDIEREGKRVGTLSTVEGDGVPLETATYSGGISVDYALLGHSDGSFSHCFAFWVEDEAGWFAYYLTLAQPMMDASAVTYLAENAAVAPCGEGVIRLNPSLQRGGKVLILGNSFVYSSNIGGILTAMLEAGGLDCEVEAVSRGYASVTDYVTEDWLRKMSSGDYAAVFLCGLYGSDDRAALPAAREACRASGTALVLFPAHNEGIANVKGAIADDPTLPHLPWKGTVEALIADGVDLWELCINDQHKHSTPLAGYVGALLIYRSLTGEMPPMLEGAYADLEEEAFVLLGEFYARGWVGEPSAFVYEMYLP